MSIICPTVLAGNEHTFRQQIERVVPFAERIQIDLMDGEFAPHKSINLDEIWWPAGVTADIHLMYKRPVEYRDTLINLKPHMVIVHAEAEGDFYELKEALKSAGVKVGLALLEQTKLEQIEPVLNELDHILIFSGELGSFGGQANLNLLEKVQAIKVINPNVEIGWDGGINEHNIKQLTDGGVDVLNVGGFIQRSDNPAHAYARLKALLEEPANAPETDN